MLLIYIVLASDLLSFQYFIEVVPTEVWGLTGRSTTYQYSVKEHTRPINHESGSHGTPGIYFKYDLSALKVEVTKDREGLVQFLVRLCASVGGLVSTSYIVCGLAKQLVEAVCCLRPGAGASPTKASLHTPAPASHGPGLLSHSAPQPGVKTNLLASPASPTQPPNIELTKSC